MAAEIHQSVSRRAAILRIIRESTVRNQDELVKVLRKQGFEATQSSVSRDLRELGVAKAGDHYIVPAASTALPATPFAAVANFVIEVRTAGPSLTVVKTTTGTAQSVAVAIDELELAGSRRHDLRRRHDLHRHRRRSRSAQAARAPARHLRRSHATACANRLTITDHDRP